MKLVENGPKLQDSLASVKATLSHLKSQLQNAPVPNSSRTDLQNSSTSSSTGDLSTESTSALTDTTSSKSSGSNQTSGSEISPSYAPQRFIIGTSFEQLCDLLAHALKALDKPNYRLQKGLISRAYLMDLVEVLMAYSMNVEAQLLLSKMKRSTHFQPTEEFVSTISTTISPQGLSELVSNIERIERSEGGVSDEAIVAIFEPFLRLQDQKSLDALFSSLRLPSTVASNLYLQSLLNARRVAEAKELFDSMLEENRKTQNLRGVDANTFAVFMNYYASQNDLRKVDTLMTMLLTEQYASPKQLHFEIAMKTFLQRSQLHKAVSIAKKMLTRDVVILNEAIAEDIVWACAQTKQFGVGSRLHRLLLSHQPAIETTRYFTAVHMCIVSRPGVMTHWETEELEKIRAKLKTQVPSSEEKPSQSDSIITTKDSKKKKTTSASTTQYEQQDALAAILENLTSASSLDVVLLHDALKSRPYESAVLLQALKTILGTLGKDTPPQAVEEIVTELKNSDELSLAFSWLPSASVSINTPGLLVQLMRSYYLRISNLNLKAIERQNQYKSMKNAIDSFASQHAAPLPWLAMVWILKSMYSLKLGSEALQTLEKALPTLPELAIAPTTHFMLPTQSIANRVKDSSLKADPKTEVGEKKRKRVTSTSESSLKDSKGDTNVEKAVEKVSAAELEQAAKLEKFKVPAQIASDFYAWCSTCVPTVLENEVLNQRTTDLANKTEVDLLSPREVRELLSAVQMGRRQQQATTKHTKNGYKLKLNKHSL